KLAVVQVDMEITEEGFLKLNIPVVSPQQPCYNNAYLPAVEASLCYCLLTQVVYDGRWNSGMADAIEINVPENSRLNADPSQSVGYATVGIGFTFAAACTESISRMYYISGLEEEVQASASGGLVAFIAAGLNRFGTFCANILFSNAVSFGGGGRIDSDGLINYHFYNPWQYISDFEADESVTNVMVLYSNRIPDSGGFGKHRAGPSNAQIAMFHKTPMALPTIVGTGSRITGNQGLYGGYPGHITKMVYLSNSNFYDLVKEGKPLPNEYEDVIDIRGKVSGDYQQFEASAPTIPMSAGTIVIYPQTTGGALGDPIERDPQLIIEDIRDGLATVEVSKKVYAVALDHETIEVDLDETKKRREARRKERISQGVPGKEYIKDLVEKRKNRELPQPALDLIDETINFSPAFKKQLEEEEKLLQKELKPIGKIKMKKLIFKLTPHVNVVEDENGNKVAMCSHCDFAYCDAREDYKLYSLIYDRAPSGVMPLHLAPDDDWATYREFYCPGCGSQTEVDQAPKGMPIIPNARIKGISY
ncbi:MAG: hydantoinase B/oxoprolinase family protein, partial [Thermodesulfobacteriota bacterium]|nr:hydantoinase B/oxoprolinase family protein [Thermodesulfobacteriota bacterium]